MQKLTSIDQIRDYFAQDNTMYYFVSASNFNLLNLQHWVKNWHCINLLDCFDGNNPDITIPNFSQLPVFQDIEEINHFLLGHKDIIEMIERNQAKYNRQKIIYLFFDDQLNEIAASLDCSVILPEYDLVRHIDNKITTTKIGNTAGVKSVPNALTKIDSYQTLLKVAQEHDLGDKFVIQTAFGDSGKTTFFIENEQDYDKVKEKIESEKVVKVMKQIRCLEAAIEGCCIKNGTVVGPLISELIGFKELTPYTGGWCGNENSPDIFNQHIRQQATEYTKSIGNQLYNIDYRGYFEVDYLIDQDTNNVYLGEINPRITGITAITNCSPYIQQQIPLFLFHLLEYDEQVECAIDIDQWNQNIIQHGSQEKHSQLIFKHVEDDIKVLTEMPASGVYQLQNDKLEYIKYAPDPTHATDPNQIFILRVMQAGEYAYSGGDLLIAFLNSDLKQGQFTLNPQGEKWIKAIKQLIQSRPLTEEEQSIVDRYQIPLTLKGFQSDPENTEQTETE